MGGRRAGTQSVTQQIQPLQTHVNDTLEDTQEGVLQKVMSSNTATKTRIRQPSNI